MRRLLGKSNKAIATRITYIIKNCRAHYTHIIYFYSHKKYYIFGWCGITSLIMCHDISPYIAGQHQQSPKCSLKFIVDVKKGRSPKKTVEKMFLLVWRGSIFLGFGIEIKKRIMMKSFEPFSNWSAAHFIDIGKLKFLFRFKVDWKMPPPTWFQSNGQFLIMFIFNIEMT